MFQKIQDFYSRLKHGVSRKFREIHEDAGLTCHCECEHAEPAPLTEIVLTSPNGRYKVSLVARDEYAGLETQDLERQTSSFLNITNGCGPVVGIKDRS